MLRTWLQTLLTSYAVTVLGVFVSVITARGLGPEGRGLLAATMLVVSLAAGVSQLGYGQAYVYLRRVEKAWQWSRLITLSSLCVGVTAGIFTLLALIRPSKADLVSVNLLVALSIATSLGGLLLNATQNEASLKTHNQSRILSTGVTLFLLSLAALADSIRVELVLGFQLVSSIFLAMLAVNWIVKDVSRADLDAPAHDIFVQFFKLTGYSLKLHVTVVSGLLINNIDKIYLYYCSSLKDLGIYSVAYATSRLIGTFQETLSTTLYTRFAGEKGNDSTETIHRAFRLTFLPMILAALLAGILGPLAMEVLFGKDFRDAGLVFSILLVECVLGGSSWLLAQQFNASGRPGVVFMRQAASLVPLLVLIPFVSTSSTLLDLAGILLLSSFVRLLVTLVLYRAKFGISMLKITPTSEDLSRAKAVFSKT